MFAKFSLGIGNVLEYDALVIAVAGALKWDMTYDLPTLPRFGEMVSGTLVHEGPGGSAANTAAWLAYIESPVVLLTKLGSCLKSRAVRRPLETLGLLTEGVVEGDGELGNCLVFRTPNGERTMVATPSLIRPLTAEDLPSRLAGSTLLWAHTGENERRGLLWQSAPVGAVRGLSLVHLAEESRYQRVNRESPRRNWDLVVGSLGEAPLPMESELVAIGCKLCVVTMGGAGAQYWMPGHSWQGVHAKKVTPADTTGAGDAFLAGLLDSLNNRSWTPANVRVAIDKGMDLATLSLTSLGAWPKL